MPIGKGHAGCPYAPGAPAFIFLMEAACPSLFCRPPISQVTRCKGAPLHTKTVAGQLAHRRTKTMAGKNRLQIARLAHAHSCIFAFILMSLFPGYSIFMFGLWTPRTVCFPGSSQPHYYIINDINEPRLLSISPSFEVALSKGNAEDITFPENFLKFLMLSKN